MAAMSSSLIAIVFVTYVHCACHIETNEEKRNDSQILRCNDVKMEDLEKIFVLQNITKLDLRNNSISSLKNLTIPESVEWIDLRGNQLTQLDRSDLDQLFRNPKRRMWLSNNSFVCDCELVTAFNKFEHQVEDFQNITCADNKNIKDLSPGAVCGEISFGSTFIITAGVVFLIKILLLSLWYRNYLKRLFYLRGWCKCCCGSEENDAVVWHSVEPDLACSQQDLVEDSKA